MFRLQLYLDIWRGAFYSVILGLMYNKANFGNPVSVHLIFFFVLISIYLIGDSTTRFNSREMVRANISRGGRKILIIWEVLWLILEMIGLLLFAIWGIYVVSNDSTTLILHDRFLKYSFLIGIFCVVNFIHNASLIQAEGNVNFLEFVLISLFRDASEIYRTSERWANYLIKKKTDALTRLEDAQVQCHEAKEKIINDFRERIKDGLHIRDIFWLFKALPYELLKYGKFCVISIDLGLTHISVQLSALHVLAFNLMVGLVIIFPSTENNFSLLRAIWPYSFLLPLFSVIFYAITSYTEINHYKETARLKYLEKLTQCIGNLLLAAFYIFWFLLLSKFWLTIVIFVQGGIFAFILLVLAQPQRTRKV